MARYPVENLFAIQEAKLKLARLGADYLVFRGGRVTVGPLSLGSTEVRALVGTAPTVIYSTSSARCRFVSRLSEMLSTCPMPLSRRAWPPDATAFLSVRMPITSHVSNSPQPVPNTPLAITGGF